MKKLNGKTPTIRCRYCKTFYESPVLNSEKGKVFRHCKMQGKTVSNQDECCRKFSPASGYYCELNNFRTSLLVCLNRRKKYQKYEAWKPCKKCRQFALEIQPIVEKYMERKIKRRGSESPHGWAMRERVITRRQFQSVVAEEVRKIKRREVRKIRRR